jgi:hypothetical protein
MKSVIVAVATLALAALAAWAEWPREPAGALRPFSAPEMVQVVPLDDVGTARDVVVDTGRIAAQCSLDMVFRSSEGPRQLSITDFTGRARLFLGDDGPALIMTDDALLLDLAGKQTPVPRPAGGAAPEVSLRCQDGRVAVLSAGTALLDQPWTGATPAGRVGVRLAAQSKFTSLALEDEDGRRVLLPVQPGEGWDRVAWAICAVLLALPALFLL